MDLGDVTYLCCVSTRLATDVRIWVAGAKMEHDGRIESDVE